MPLIPVLFWTDALVYLLILSALVFGLYAARHEHLRAPWRQVVRSPVGMAALVVLAAYGSVGLLDTVHVRLQVDQSSEVRYSPEVLSLLDLLLTDLRTRQEKTYSAPLATHLYAKESIVQADGTVIRDYPRLQYGGAHLKDPERERTWDIAWRSLRGLIQGLALWSALFVALIAWLASRQQRPFAQMRDRILCGQTEIPWRVALLTLGLILILGAILAELSQGYHVLGTDKVGEDVFYQMLKGIRTGLVIGTLTTLVMLPAALSLGVAAGYFGGWVDDLIQYLYTTLNSIPGVLLIAAAILMLQVYMHVHAEEFASLAERADLRLLWLCIILGVTSWTGLCRLLRGEALKLRESDYILAARALGVGHFAIIVRHLLPNLFHIVLITVVLDFSGLVLAEAVLSYVNIGVDPTMHSWGNMINSARLELARDPVVWWSLAAAFGAMFVLVLAANLFADVVRDAFDPRLRTLWA
ncbi:ABC transporter permease [Caldichromatium japonicum]|uniref:ABC transporter permease n=1 Tax=Caldichromatium japonicum TaxID=2699430 RepID=A0A6G7VBY9_9GAMM|nr:ABC transporter permease [Caldichromatium japonicum]QIK37368.1 ABC transporter permease [Caldichromatium japonicum]